MTKESIDILIENLSVLDYIKVTKEITDLQQENKKLQTTVNIYKEIIHKAIEYIENIQNDYNNKALNDNELLIFEACIHGVTKMIEIKEILKGDSNE